jgi:hypothetical protein
MTALRLVSTELAKLGYSAIERDYVFADVFAASVPDRVVPLAAFTHSPPSYRNAALAAVEAQDGMRLESVEGYRALGAPLLLVIEGQQVTVWQIHPERRPTVYRRIATDQPSALFAENQDLWKPRRIHNAKSFGPLNVAYQLDFV